MTTANDVLSIARQHLDEPGDRFWDWYPAPYGTAWCCIFASYCLSNAGLPTHHAWVSALFDEYRSAGRASYDVRSAQPGDLLAFEWGSTPGGYDHIGIAEEIRADGIVTIEGNVDGSHVRRLWRTFAGGGIAEIARPTYDQPTTEGVTVYQFTRTKDDRIVLFGVGMGAVAHRWQDAPNSGFSEWHTLADGQPFPVEALTAERNADGRFEIMAWGPSGVCYRTQNADTTWRPWRTEL